MFTKKSEEGYQQPLDGIDLKTLVHGNNTSMHEFIMKKGSSLPPHGHPHEQTGYLISGRLTLVIDGQAHEVDPGDSWNISGDVEHSVEVHEDALVVEVFTPVREEYIQK